MKTRPILFSAPMVRALLDGTKTQTRRIVKPQPYEGGRPEHWSVSEFGQFCPYGQPGDQLWVRESFWGCDLPGYGDQPCVVYDDEWHGNEYSPAEARPWGRKFGRIPSIHMPRDCSRITLEIVSVRVERLQNISGPDALAEGIAERVTYPPESDPEQIDINAYRALWETINGAGAWALNPWVWVIEFKRVEE